MYRPLHLIASCFLAIHLASTLSAQSKKATMGIAQVKATAGVEVSNQATINSLARISHSLDQQLIASIQSTRKFALSARSDLDRLLEESAATGNGFAIQQLDYLLVVTLDDFQDHSEVASFENLGKTVEKRVIRLSGVAKIYDTQSGSLLESSSVQLEQFDTDLQKNSITGTSGKLSDSLIASLSRDFAEKVANNVTDIIYPAKILAATGPQITFNRGQNSGIEVGELWNVYALGEALVDPDTGEILGSDEVEVGSIRITQVLPKFSKGKIVENYGIEKGQIIRPVTE